jgi:hypothetical protein
MPQIPQALEIGTTAAADSKATREALLNLQSAAMWLRTVATMVASKANKHHSTFTKAIDDPAYVEAAELIGLDAGKLIEYTERLQFVFIEKAKPAPKKKAKAAK